MAFKYDPIQGLHTKTGFHKSILKGEDAWLQKPGVKLSSSPSGNSLLHKPILLFCHLDKVDQLIHRV